MLIWYATAYLAKRKQAGGVQFSRDPLNLLNKHSRKYAGYCNDKAIGIQADDNTVALTTKYAAAPFPHLNPNSLLISVSVSPGSPRASTSPRNPTRPPPSPPPPPRGSSTAAS